METGFITIHSLLSQKKKKKKTFPKAVATINQEENVCTLRFLNLYNTVNVYCLYSDLHYLHYVYLHSDLVNLTVSKK